MRALLVSDSHFAEESRFDECVRLHAWVVEQVATRGVDVVLHGGDLYDHRSTPRERAAVADWVRAVTEHAPLVIARGNHDLDGDIAFLGRLATRHPVHALERPEVVRVAGAAIAVLPWPRKAALLAALGPVPKEHAGEAAHGALRAVLAGLGAQLEEHAGPRILLAHAMVRGSVTSTGQPLVGCDLELGLEDLALAGADVYALGHIHRGQAWTIGQAPVVYPGSPRRTAFGELEEKGVVLLDLEDAAARACVVTELAAPATRMLLVEGHWDAGLGALVLSEMPTWSGAEIRLRYRVAPEHRAAARSGAQAFRQEMLDAGAAAVKIEEETVGATRARADVSRARSLREQVEVLWETRGDTPQEPLRTRLIEKVRDLEEASCV